MTSPKGTGPLVGGVPSLKQAALERRQRGRTNRVLSMSLLGTVLIAAAIAATSGVLSSTRSTGGERAVTAPARVDGPTKVVVKRPLPEGMTDEGVVKWVPIRQPSGRTELEAWTSVDHHWAEMPEMIDGVMASQRARERGESTSEWPVEEIRSQELADNY